MTEIPINKKYLTACIVLALMLCLTQIMGYTLPILACLAIYMALAALCCCYDFTLPFLLFFLPWSPILRTDPTSHSFYTFAMVLVCLISIIKKRFYLRNYQLKAGILLLLVTLISKVLDGNFLSFDYIAFIMMIVLFPGVKEEWREGKYDFYQCVSFFALGVIIASLCALNFANYSNIAKYIRVDAYLTIIRRSGFYGDANFYTAQILAAMGGVLALLLQEKKKGQLVFLGVILAFLLYSGFLSGSKSFALVAILMILLWIIAVLKLKGKTGLKLTMLICLSAGVIYIATSALFRGLIAVLLTRFGSTKDLDSFTTGRTGLWASYLKEFFGSAKVFFLGRGFTNIKINGRASHNTIIQFFYQFGIIGIPVLIYWIACFFRDSKPTQKTRKRMDLKIWIVFIGAFVPWLAIDALFFDEFFLLQWYMLLALNYLGEEQEPSKIETGSDGG